MTYFRLFDTLLNVVFSLLPMPCIAPIAATAIRAAMSNDNSDGGRTLLHC